MSRRLSYTAVSVVAAVATFLGVVPAQAVSSPPDWKAAVSTLADTAYSMSAPTYESRAAAAVRPVLSDSLGTTRMDEVEADASTRYLDGVRFLDEDAGRAAYEHEQQFVSYVRSRLSGNDLAATAAPGYVNALTDTLLAGEVTADAAIQDAAVALGVPATEDVTGSVAETDGSLPSDQVDEGVDTLAGAPAVTSPGGRSAAVSELAKARRALAEAEEALRKSLPVSASVHQGLAWRHAYHVLVHLGITYTGDADQDGVTDVLELRLGASPLVQDSDGDGLTDSFEAFSLLSFTLPSQRDTDGDGVSDAAEDVDGDGLTNLQEQAAGTSPTEPDTDGDRSTDGDESARATDPTKADTDGDTLLDSAEPALGFSAASADTDRDGVRDDEEVVHADASGPDGVRLTLVGTGDLLSSLRVGEVVDSPSVADTVPGMVGKAYDFSLSKSAYQGFQQAELRLPYDPGAEGAEDPSQLRVFWLDEANHIWRPASESQSVDAEHHVVKATVSHFSTYAIFNIANWQQTWTAAQDPCRKRTGGGGTDVVLLDLSLILDSSGSMSWNDPDGLRKSAAKNFVDALLPDDRAAVVDFDSWSYVLQGLTSNKEAVKSAIDRIDDWGGTNIAAGVRTGTDLLINNGDPDRARMAILLTDGVGYYDDTLTARANANEIAIYTIGLGNDVDPALLGRIATGTGGQYYHVSSPDELPQVFRRISEDTGQDPGVGKDTDGDGLDDCTEIKGMRDGWGKVHVTDPTNRDTDGDGVFDGDEAGTVLDYFQLGGSAFAQMAESGTVTWSMVSAPDIADTDSDGLDDAHELDVDAYPWVPDSDYDLLLDGAEADTYKTSPTASNSDGDDFDDFYEVGHAGDGFDPGVPDERVSKWTYAKDFAVGMLLGDFKQMDSLAWLAGYLAASGSSAIPVVGWVTGTLADLRDTIANLIHGDWVGAGLSGLSLVPDIGDAVAIPGKALKFVSKYTHRFDATVHLIIKSGKVPDAIKTATLKLLLGGRYDALRAAGFSDEALRTVSKADRTYIKAIADAMSSPLHRPASALAEWAGRTTVPMLSRGRAGEELLESVYGATTKGVDNQVVMKMDPPLIGNGRRTFDVVDNGPSGKVAHESKVGNDPRSDGLRQCRKDGALMRSGHIAQAHWHFFAYSRYGSIGADPEVLSCLQEEGILFTFHPPA